MDDTAAVYYYYAPDDSSSICTLENFVIIYIAYRLHSQKFEGVRREHFIINRHVANSNDYLRAFGENFVLDRPYRPTQPFILLGYINK